MGFLCSLCGKLTLKPVIQSQTLMHRRSWITVVWSRRNFSGFPKTTNGCFSTKKVAYHFTLGSSIISPYSVFVPNKIITKRLFCTVPKQNQSNVSVTNPNRDSLEQTTRTTEGGEKTPEPDKYPEEWEANLTEEEQKLLRELEEEQRRHQEERVTSHSYDNHFLDDQYERERGAPHLSESVAEDYMPFENQQRIIQDVIDEIWSPIPQPSEHVDEVPQYFPRGRTGVFDLSELVELIRNENAEELVAIALPAELDYADHMVIVTVRNKRQLEGLATFVRKRFKMKDRKRTDALPFYDKSVDHQGWIALDLGNIILHIFMQSTRDHYDLETLWTVGPLFDDLSNEKPAEIDQLLNML